jgi:UDP-N-acetyl-D-galactosamine dehydrogenase
MEERIGVVGLGYVGLPVALALARRFPGTIGFDINPKRIQSLCKGFDSSGESTMEEIRDSNLSFTSDPSLLSLCSFIVVAVPTPIDSAKKPDLSPLISASRTVGNVIKPGTVVVYESTVYPGVTEDICGRILAETSGLKQGVDFKLGYSPERINPGDKLHRLENITKVVSGEDAETLDRVADVYGAIIQAGIHRAPSIKVAEAAKVIENTQRDLNIALMNELARIFDLVGICTQDVLEAAGTKWNFLKFQPGLVGGHCIGVDPFYLTTLAEQHGYHPQVILSGRCINDDMGRFVAQKTIKLLSQCRKNGGEYKIGVLGLTFKEDVPDIRNSRVPDIIQELMEYGIEPLVHDPLANPEEAMKEYGVHLADWDALHNLDAVILAVPHREYTDTARCVSLLRKGASGVIVDVKSVLSRDILPDWVTYWRL